MLLTVPDDSHLLEGLKQFAHQIISALKNLQLKETGLSLCDLTLKAYYLHF